MKPSKIELEFYKLKKEYNLPALRLCISRHLTKKYSGPHCMGFYAPSVDIICLKSNTFTANNITTLLHEMRHALQHKQKRLHVPLNHTKKLYTLELEAELFSITEYFKKYSNILGEAKGWDLAPYHYYRLTWMSAKYKLPDDFKPDTLDDVLEFLESLEPEQKKHILEIIKSYKSNGKKKSKKRTSEKV